ncbi:MAG TPA: FmdB family zinc ribbon protein [Bryobacteraceae bacterium]|jgi:putative FmdB family regulatory protein
MALYEYQCENCGEVFELIQKFADEPLTVHEKCGGKVHRLISAPMLQFKGSGWYVNDYAKGTGNSANGETKKTESAENTGKKESSTSKSDSGSPAKPADSSSSATPAASTTTSSSSSDKK